MALASEQRLGGARDSLSERHARQLATASSAAMMVAASGAAMARTRAQPWGCRPSAKARAVAWAAG